MPVTELDPIEKIPHVFDSSAAGFHNVADQTDFYKIDSNKVDSKRYRRERRFFIRATFHLIWWDIILDRPLLRRFRKPYLPRWQQLAQDFRSLAVEMGGILIKLGQFLSSRVDLLPPEITEELAGLQDEVPAVPTRQIIAQIESDFRRPVGELFAHFWPEAVGSASLAQVHKAQLISGEQVAVKVLRPGIKKIVETDLKVIGKFLRRLKYYRPIKRYVDLDRLTTEFITVTSRELNLESEGNNAERLAQDFADNSQVYIPKIYWDYTSGHTLTMEDASYIKIHDLAAIDAAGISRHEIVEKLFNLYLEQIIVKHFVHADPHPGNLFIKPLPHPDEALIYENSSIDFRPGDAVPYYPDRPFQIAFVDFGMAVAIPKRLRDSLRNYIIGIGTKDARMIVDSYLDAGILLPDADMDQVEEMTEALLERFSGSLLGQMKDINLEEYAEFYAQYKVLLYNSPFQFQSDLLFVMRALGILSGTAAKIAPSFDPMKEVMPFARRLMQESWQPQPERIAKAIPRLLKLPDSLEDVLTRAQRGQLSFETSLNADAKKIAQQLRNSVNRLAVVLLAVGLFVAGVIWQVGNSIIAAISRDANQKNSLGIFLMALAALVFLLDMIKRKKE